MSQPVFDMAMTPIAQAPAAAEAPAPSDLLAVIERLAANPSVDVTKLEKIIDLQNRVLDREARAAFEGAFSAMQADLPEITERGEIKKRDGSVQSRYARLEDIITTIRPVLTSHGFSLRHRTEWPADRQGTIRIVGVLSHRQGHSEESAFEAPMDRSDYRSEVQSMGSTVSYGRRYTTIDLLNIVTRGLDNDAQKPEEVVASPAGFDQWFSILTEKAKDGLPAIQAMWDVANKDPELKKFASHLLQTNARGWNDLKVRASKVKGVTK